MRRSARECRVSRRCRSASAANGRASVKGEEDYTFHPVYQDSYALVNAFAAWDIQPNLTVRGNVNNISDEKYITSLYDVGYYGAPRNYSVSVDWRF